MTDTVLDEALRERWADEAAGAAALADARAELERRLDADDGGAVARSHIGRAHQRLSEICRLSGMLDESLKHKDAALRIWTAQSKHRATYLLELQRALVLAELGRAHDSKRELTRLHAVLAGDEMLEPFYLDFWLEYDARRSAMAGEQDAAVERLQEALELRRATRADRIVEWTEYALSKVLRADDPV